MDKVSVIIPNYNHAPYLEQRINSVLNQDYEDFEVLVLDDCSTDNSRDIIENYRNHPKISAIIYNNENSRNTFLQWRKGIELANGDWVWIAESDDWCESTLLGELVKGTTISLNCTLSYCQSTIFKNNEILYVSGTNKLTNTMAGVEFVLQHMIKKNSVFNASMCIFKRSAYLNVGNEFTDYKFIGDWIFWIEIALQGKVYISGRTLNYFRKHPNDVTSNALKTGLYYFEYFRLLNYLESKYKLIGNSKTVLLIEMQKQFRSDTEIALCYKNSVNQKFKEQLRSIYYIELVSYNLRNAIRKTSNLGNSLLPRVAKKMKQFI